MSITLKQGIHTNKKMLFCLLTIQLLTLYFPILQFFSIQTDNGTIPASACYFFSLVFAPYLLKNLKSLRLPPWCFTVLYFYTMLLAAFRIPQYGLSKSVLHWSFGFYLLVIIVNVGVNFTKDDWLLMLEIGACIFAVVRFIYLLFQIETVLYLLNGYFWGTISGYSGELLLSLTRGGRNLDASWLGLGLFFVRGKKKFIYATFVILFSFLGCSRVGVIAIGLGILWSLLYDPLYKLTKKTLKWYVIYAVVMLGILFASGMGQTFLARVFQGIQTPGQLLQIREDIDENVNAEQSGISSTSEQGMSHPERRPNNTQTTITPVSSAELLNGRMRIWTNIPQMFKNNPFGYGVGNAIRIMRAEYGFTGAEEVVHNVFFQWLIDEGILGGIAYLGLLIAFLYRQWKNRPRLFHSPFDGYFATWFILTLVQFHGAEALMIFVLGCFLMSTNVRAIEVGAFVTKRIRRK